ncbi:hypothetical protein SteCoe_19094 [Stentor coeruleus]|uniref:30S ribosomal protein S15 n=1 Tax=Stentor coeruleus TaxID=5963 RepID=A0A1R2BV21_9CILI|nr:hypothetical protein SteCoe_19094 [Stentor coeruleus]
MLGKVFAQARLFSKSSDKAILLTIAAKRIKKQFGQVRKNDLLRIILPNEKQVSAFDKRPLPYGHRQFLDDVFDLANDQVKQAYSIENATPREIKFARKMELVKRWGKDEKDFGHPAVQVGAMTEDIMFLANHVRNNNLDTLAYLNLRKSLDKRRKALQYLARYDYHAYEDVCNYLGINKLNYHQHKEVKNLRFQNS